jgi:transposase
MKLRLGIDVACRAAHQATLADQSGALLWSGRRFRTSAEELARVWAWLPAGADPGQVLVVMEPTRNAWVPLAGWFAAKGAQVVLVPPEQAADLRDYYYKHAKTDRLDSRVLARLPLLHPGGLRSVDGLGPAQALRRAVRLRANLVKRRSTALQRLDALLELLGPFWTDVLGTALTKTALVVLERYADPHALKRLGKPRLTRLLYRHSRGAWGQDKAQALLDAADQTLALWGEDGLDYVELADDIAVEVRLAQQLTVEIAALEERIDALYRQADPDQLVASGPGIGPVLAAAILGRLGDAKRFDNLAGVRAFTGLVPAVDQSGTGAHRHGPTKAGDAYLRDALVNAAEHARRVDPTLAARYHRLMTQAGKHHNAALCTIAAVLVTRLAACWRTGQPYQLRDTDGSSITPEQGRAICAQRYTVPAATRTARRSIRQSIDRKNGTGRRSKESPSAPSTGPSTLTLPAQRPAANTLPAPLDSR